MQVTVIIQFSSVEFTHSTKALAPKPLSRIKESSNILNEGNFEKAAPLEPQHSVSPGQVPFQQLLLRRRPREIPTLDS
jgi:hypothetical protein